MTGPAQTLMHPQLCAMHMSRHSQVIIQHTPPLVDEICTSVAFTMRLAFRLLAKRCRACTACSGTSH